MRKLLIATHNQGKLKKFREILKTYNFEISSLLDINITQILDEDGDTFEENSLKKAKFYANISGLLTLSDDGGLEIPVLNNLPGVNTRDWDSKERLSDEKLIAKILDSLKEYKGDDRKAYLRSVITIYDPKTSLNIVTESKIEGLITEKLEAKVDPGFPVRSLFFVPAADKLICNFNKSDLDKYNHRKLAIEKIRTELIKLK